MKFSWISLNYFINLNNITINKLTEILTTKGFEIDQINYDTICDDYILDIGITANRQDTLSMRGLAIELSCILNQPIINNNTILNYQINKNNLIKNKKPEYLSNIKINKIINIKNNSSPLWLRYYLKIHEINSQNLIIDIQEYIKIKWGHEIHFFNLDNRQISNQTISKNNLQFKKNSQHEEIIYKNITLIKVSKNNTQINNQLKYKDYTSSIISCSYIYNDMYLEKLKNTYNRIDEMQGYYEALQLVATFGKGSISKSYSYNDFLNKNKFILNINKNLIQYTLGPIYTKKSKYLELKTIYQILKQIRLKPQYNYYNKNFQITIPKYRYNDLYRKIDIIEEIGRIYGYQKFMDKIKYINKKGTLSKQYQIIKDIRQYFRDIGLHEAINSSLHKSNKINVTYNISIYNPLLDDQSNLRNNLIENLIKNLIYNYKQKNNNTEFFEIGKIFKTNLKTKTKKENINIAGILTNKNFIKKTWETKHSKLNWFHAKGILEQFFEKMQINTEWNHIDTLNQHEIQSLSFQNFDIRNTVCIRNQINNKIIGLMGPINYSLYQKIPNDEIINIFELNIDEIIKNQNEKSHLSYTFTDYSIYPSVIRDLSIKIKKNINIINIKEFIYSLNTNFIQKVEIFNQYIDKTTNKKCIGIRIIYNAKNKTLNKNDLKLIDQDIIRIYKTYENK